MRTRAEALLVCVVVMIEGKLTSPAAALATNNTEPMCPRESVADYIFGFRDRNCVVSCSSRSCPFLGLTEGDEVSLQMALNMVDQNFFEFAAVLCYASWCPFCRTFRPSFSTLSSLHPAIPHFAIEELSVKPSITSKYGVHGFPTLFLIKSTMRMQYHGSRTLSSLVAFYNDVTVCVSIFTIWHIASWVSNMHDDLVLGIETASLDKGSLDRIEHAALHGKHDSTTVESCLWAISPNNLLGRETYLALATAFVVLRLRYLSFPTLLVLLNLLGGGTSLT